MLTVFAEICIKPGRRAAVLQAIERLTPLVLEEEGCGSYQALIDHAGTVPWKQTSPDSIFMVEHWASLEHLEKHLQIAHMAAHREVVKDDVTDVKIFVLEPAL